jgi:glycosyltransferase involved in cell wall biosynthesis
MKVLFFNYEYPPLGGGAANATDFILREYAKIPDFEVDLVTSSIDSEYHLDQIGDRVRIHKLPIGKNENNLHFQSQKDLLIYAWKAYRFSQKLIQKNQYDLTHSFFTVPCGAISWMIRRKYKIPYIISLRGSDVPGYSDRFSFIYSILTFFIVEIWKKSAAVISNSEELKELALKTNSKQAIDIIANGVDIEKFRPAIEKRDAKKIYLTVGATRLTARKGTKYLIEAIDSLVKKGRDIHMIVMGEGDDKENLEKQVAQLDLQERIKFVGRIPNTETSAFYQKANIFVLPSLNEGMSNAMLEALASGLPLISTDTGGAKQIIQAGKNGFIVRMKDSADIAEKIEKIINNPELIISMGNESRRIAEGMSWASVAEKYFDLYKAIIK